MVEEQKQTLRKYSSPEQKDIQAAKNSKSLHWKNWKEATNNNKKKSRLHVDYFLTEKLSHHSH